MSGGGENPVISGLSGARMKENSAYLLSAVDVGGQEVKRLSAQAQLFLDLELPFLLARAPAQGRVADFGSGSGAIGVALAQALPGCQVWGLDADPLAVSQGQALAESQGNLSFHRFALGQGQSAPLQGLDIAFSRLVLLHVSDPTAALRDMAAALQPQGQVYVVETDDSMMRFQPVEAWQSRLLDLLEAVQVSRGGSRRRGAGIGNAMLAAGLRPKAVETVWYRKSAIGPAAFGELFVPVMDFYLKEAVRLGLAPEDDSQALGQTARAFIADPATEIAMALLHWAGTLQAPGT